MKHQKKFSDILSRFRNDVLDFSEKFGGVAQKKSNFKADLSRKEKRKLERKLKNAKKLAFNRKEKIPTMEIFLESQRKGKKLKKNLIKTEFEDKSKKSNKSEKEEKNDKKQKKLNSIERIENRISKEVKEEKKYQESFQDSLRRKLIEDNEQDEQEIAKLEKLLHIKKDRKKYKQAFYDEGFADLLDFCDEEKRKSLLKKEANMWFDTSDETTKKDEADEKLKHKKEKIQKLNKKLKKEISESESDNSDQTDIEDEDDEEEHDASVAKNNDFFIQPNKKQVLNNEQDEDVDRLNSEGDEFNSEDFEDEDEDMVNEEEVNGEDDDDDELNSQNSDEDGEDQTKYDSGQEEYEKQQKELAKKGLKEDIYGRVVDKKGNVVSTNKYVPPAQRLKKLLEQSSNENAAKLTRLSKTLNGLLNRLSTTNMISIMNQIVQMFYSNQYTRFDLIETLYNLIDNSLINANCMTPIRLIIEHAALISALTTSIGVELGATILQKLCQKLNADLKDEKIFMIENKLLDNLTLFLCNLYNFKLFSPNLLIDLLNDHFIESLNLNEENKNSSFSSLIKIEKSVDIILLILRSVGFSLRKDNPIQLKDLIIKLQSKINAIRNKFEKLNDTDTGSANNRLKFMLESVNAIKNNDIRRLDAFDQTPIDQIKKQMKNAFKEDQTLLNISYNDLINANELGRWWIVGSAWNLKENEKDIDKNKNNLNKDENKTDMLEGGYSEKILQLAKEQRMNTDIRRAIFCIIVSAEDYTDAFMKLVKLTLKKTQEREIIYIIMHCALNEKKSNPYYYYLMQKFCEYDRRFKMTLQFHTWDKFKMLTSMSKQHISNLASLYTHLIGTGVMSLSILKTVEFGEMNKSMLQFLRELFTNLLMKYNDEQIQEIFMRFATIKKLYQLRNAIKLFIYHFMLTDKGKDIVIDNKLKEKCQMTEKILSINSND